MTKELIKICPEGFHFKCCDAVWVVPHDEPYPSDFVFLAFDAELLTVTGTMDGVEEGSSTPATFFYTNLDVTEAMETLI